MTAIPSDLQLAASALHADVSRRAVVRLGGASLAALLLAASTRPGTAQDASPAATPVGATGTSSQLMGSGQPASAPGLELSLRRITIAPGGRIPAHSHPGALVIFVEAGTWGYTALGGTALLTRGAGAATPTAATPAAAPPSPAEQMPLGTEVILKPGDSLFVEDPQDDVRNAGDDDVVLLVAGLTRVGEPFTAFMEADDTGGTDTEATPNP